MAFEHGVAKRSGGTKSGAFALSNSLAGIFPKRISGHLIGTELIFLRSFFPFVRIELDGFT